MAVLEPLDMAGLHQMVEVGDRLPHGKADLMAVEAGREQDIEQVAGGRPRSDMAQDQVEPRRVMNGQLAQPVLEERVC